MIKKIYITNATGTSGKDTFFGFVEKYISAYKYTIANLGYEAAKIFGYNKSTKTEKDRRFISDLIDLGADYNDSPFRDVESIVADFKNNFIDTEVLVIDMRNPKDITRAVKTFGAETILIRNPRVEKIESNHADANVENYKYDYIIENDGTLEQLEKIAKVFVCDVIVGKEFPKTDEPLILTCSKY